jgi:uncharacterized membrane protein
MVLELKVPHDTDLSGLIEQWPIFLSYALSFFLVGIYWVNHHHLFRPVKHLDPRILWLNLLLLFCLSLVPFATAYVGESRMAPLPVAVYSVVMLLPALAFLLLHACLVATHEGEVEDAAIARSARRKNWLASAMYAAAIPFAFVHPAISLVLIFAVGIMYFVPIDYF